MGGGNAEVASVHCPQVIVPFYFQYCSFLFQNCPFVFQKCLVFQKYPIVFHKCSLVFQKYFLLFTLQVFFQEYFFSSWLYLLILLRAAQRDNICIAHVLFLRGIISWSTYYLPYLVCVRIQPVNKASTPVDIIVSYFLCVNRPWYNFNQCPHFFKNLL